jgi:hypothetical protein
LILRAFARIASARRLLAGFAFALLAGGLALPADAYEKPRLIVASDIGNEPDDSESLVRLLVYSDRIDIRGLVASTSTWQRGAIHPELMRERIAAYGKVLANLRVHDPAYPDASHLLSLVKRGSPHYGLSHVGDGCDTEASDWIIAEADRPDERPLWILNWGGSADLAQALYTVRKTRSPDKVRAFVAKLRVYSISDQDDAGPWVRQNFPDLFWIASIHAFSQYTGAEWSGISDDVWSDPHAEHMSGPDTSLVTNAWIDAYIRKGPLGRLYPNWKYIMEGDSPSLLYLISQGLGDPEHPDWGSWGGRYGKVAPQYGLYSDVADTAVGVDGKPAKSSKAAIWRWRAAYQNDFAARIAWSVTPSYRAANHPPEAVLNGKAGFDPVFLSARPGEAVALSAAESRDPDGGRISYKWWVYDDAGSPLASPQATLAGADTAEATLTVQAASAPVHVILEVRDSGTPSLVAYRRAVINVQP